MRRHGDAYLDILCRCVPLAIIITGDFVSEYLIRSFLLGCF